MHRGFEFARLLSIALPLLTAGAAGARSPEVPVELKRAVVRQYAAMARAMYTEIERRGQTMQARIGEFLANPSPASLERARDAWVEARRAYGQSEVLRFYAGPIDDPKTGVETLVNAWPVDEAYIDSVRGNESAGIINSPQQHPNLNVTMLSVWNERGGEANISTGWHAVEFLLWGQDFNPSGPGDRPFSDFVVGAAPNAARRAEYLRLATQLLLDNLRTLRDAWAPDAGTGSYRAAFEAAPPDESLRKILTGMIVLGGFEMSGERMAVSYETRDQEQEHSCFSDTTHNDLVANQLGVEAVFLGRWASLHGPGVRDVALALDAALARQIEERISASLAALRAIVPPFDQAILAADDSPARLGVLAGIEALENQTASLSALSEKLGFKIAIEPGG